MSVNLNKSILRKKKGNMKKKNKYKYRLLSRKDKRFDLQTRRFFFIWMYIYDEEGLQISVEKREEAIVKIKNYEWKPDIIKL